MRDQRLRQRFERARAQVEGRRLESNPDSHAGIPEDTGAPRSRGAGSARGSGVGSVRACQPGSASDGRLPASPVPLRAPGDSRGRASRSGALGVGAHGAASSSSPPTSPHRMRRAPRCSRARLEPSFLPAGPAQPLTSLLPGPGPVPTSRPDHARRSLALGTAAHPSSRPGLAAPKLIGTLKTATAWGGQFKLVVMPGKGGLVAKGLELVPMRDPRTDWRGCILPEPTGRMDV